MTKPPLPELRGERDLAAVATVLAGARVVRATGERALLGSDGVPPAALVRALRGSIQDGHDPLGDAFLALRSAATRRAAGAVYTPPELVKGMLDWARRRNVARVVDAGAGSGRFVRAAGRAFPRARLVAVETDPLARLLLCANARVEGLLRRLVIHAEDYRTVALGAARGRTLFVGNPPYVRHHGIEPGWKGWLAEQAARLGLGASKLAGLHVHFLLATALHAREGDLVVFVTSAEWLDVGYGKLARELLLGPLGLVELHRLEPRAQPFARALTTAVVVCCEVGKRPSAIGFRPVTSLARLSPLTAGRLVARDRVETTSRWSALLLPRRRPAPGTIELGELFRVHRGQVTGNNAVWIVERSGAELPPRVLRPAVTRARELFDCRGALHDAGALRCVVDLPVDLDELDAEERRAVERFLARARRLGAHRAYVARHRRAWWSVGLYAPAPILATYMARRPPVFVRNVVEARHVNVVHGLYPREPLPATVLDSVARHLCATASTELGRTYAGGLTKFEPSEMARLRIPSPG